MHEEQQAKHVCHNQIKKKQQTTRRDADVGGLKLLTSLQTSIISVPLIYSWLTRGPPINSELTRSI